MAFWGSSHRQDSDSLENRITLGLLLAGGLMAALLILRFLLPWLLMGGAIALGYWFWRRQQRRKQHLHRLFYDLLRARGGRLSALEFAMAAQIQGREARTFLDARAREFCGNFEPVEQGDILYTFAFQTDGANAPSKAPPKHSPTLSSASASEDLANISIGLSELANRLNCSVTCLEQHKWAADFAYWSQGQDPDGIAWRVDPISDRCFPITGRCLIAPDGFS